MWICTTLTILVSFSTAETGIEDLNVRVNTLENLMKHYVRVIEKQSEEISHLKKTVVSLTAINEELELFKSKTKSKTQSQRDQEGLAERAETEDDADTMTDCLESKEDQIEKTEIRPASKTLTKTKSRILRGLVPFNRGMDDEKCDNLSLRTSELYAGNGFGYTPLIVNCQKNLRMWRDTYTIHVVSF